jgi:hypothetical protein
MAPGVGRLSGRLAKLEKAPGWGSGPSARQLAESERCRAEPAYFISTYCKVLSEEAGDWAPFALWPGQVEALNALVEHRLVVFLKARQLGATWLVLAFVLWLALTRPIVTVLLFSKRDDEAVDLLRTRLKGMYRRLPDWLRSDPAPGDPDNDHELALGNGSRIKAFPTGTGDSYTASLAFVDEADLVPDLDRLMRAVKPTIDGGGRMVLLSRSDKGKPESPFKRIYRAARQGASGWYPLFLPWSARPGRDAAWYEAQRRDVYARTGALDDLFEQYPATEAEALTARTLDKRLAPQWLSACYREAAPAQTLPAGAPSLAGLEVYAGPQAGRRYVLGADPAEGNPTSDDSAMTVLDCGTGEECAALAGKFDPSVFASHITAVAGWYNGAATLAERNNHGHATLLWLRDNSKVNLLRDHDNRDGWNTTTKSKALLWATAADAFRDGTTVLHSFATFTQLTSIEGATLRAPEGQHDDRAMSYALALQARALDASPEWNLFVINLPGPRLGRPAPAPAPTVGSADVRWFSQSQKYQSTPTVNGQKVYGPEFATEAEAVYAGGLLRHAAGEPRPEAPEGLDGPAGARVLEKVARWLAQSGRANGLPPALPPGVT